MSSAESVHFVIQDDCYKHQYRRTNDLDDVFERPQRLRFLNLGLSTALAWRQSDNPIELISSSSEDPITLIRSPKLLVSRSTRRISVDDKAVRTIHPSSELLLSSDAAQSASIEPGAGSQKVGYLDHLIQLCRQASAHHQRGQSEVPSHLPQGDLYELYTLDSLSSKKH